MNSVTDHDGGEGRREEKEHFMECLPAGFLRCTKAGRIDYASEGILALYGCCGREEFQELCGGSIAGMVLAEDRRRAFGELEEQLRRNPDSSKTEFRVRRRDGEIRWVDCRGCVVTDLKGNVCFGGVLIDDTEAKMARQSYWEQARRDSLTGLLNRTACKTLINAYQDWENQICALMIVDIDNFKTLNDTWGHLFGDTVLTEIARRLQALFRRSDVVGRIGGDEFIIFLRDLNDLNQPAHHGQRIVQSIGELRSALKNAVEVTCSVGIAVSPRDGGSFEQLLERADCALYWGKRNGKNRYTVYAPHMSVWGEENARDGEREEDSGIESEIGLRRVNTQIIQYVFRALYDSVNLEEAIRLILQIIGRQFGVSRVYIFENQPDGIHTDNTFEWCNDGIRPEMDYLQNVSFEEDVPGYTQNFNEKGIFFCQDISRLEEKVRLLLESQHIKSTLQCAFYDSGILTGFVGFDECRRNRLWTGEQIEALSFVAKILGTFLIKERAKKKMEGQVNGLKEVLDKLPGWVYVVDADTYALLYLNEKTKKTATSSRIGKYCYCEFMGLGQPCQSCPAREVLRRGGPVTMEIYNGFLNLWADAAGIPVVWEGRRAVLLSLQDITKYKRLQAYMPALSGKSRSDGPLPVAQDETTAIYASGQEEAERYGEFNSTGTVMAAALEIFRIQDTFAKAVQVLLAFLGRRYGLSRVSLYMNNSRDSGKNTIYQWVDNQTAQPISLSDSFRKEEFFICHGLYDQRGTVVLSEDRYETYKENLRRVLEQSGALSVLFAGLYTDGRYIGQLALVSCSQARAWDELERGEVAEVAGLIASEAKTLEALDDANRRAEYYRDVDSLTGLFTYNMFKELAQKSLDQGVSRRVLVASDIKGFKYINSAIGYTQGDNILRMFADMMVQSSGPEVINARVNGDVFLTLGVYEDRADFQEKLLQSNENFARLQNQIYDGINIRVRSGVYFLDPDCREIDLAVDRANLARKSVDYILKSTVVLYKDAPFSIKLRENEMINRMEYALMHGEFQVYYQPKIYLEDGSVAGAEALVRWVREDGSVIPPDEFIPLFEKNGFITKIDIFVLRRVCRWLKEREERGEPLFKISVNLSGADVRDEQIVSYIADQVEEFGISPEYLEFELTETAFLSDTEQIFSVLKRLQDMGFTTSIDDFGSGYSIMNMVAEIPTDIVKMDCAFVQNCGKSDRGREFLSQLVLMVRKMGFVALCEGIETEDHLSMVEKMGCELGQGYYFSRPVPQPEFEEWLKKQRFHPGEICGIV